MSVREVAHGVKTVVYWIVAVWVTLVLVYGIVFKGWTGTGSGYETQY